MLLLLLLVVCGGGVEGGDPAPILYPGQVNIGLLTDIHQGCDGPLRPHAVHRAMAAVWAAHQANFADPHSLNIGVFIYDTCGNEEVAERQAYRLLGHVTNDCPSDKKMAPLVAVVTEGDMESLHVPLKLLRAFSVPVVTATSTPGIPSTAPSPTALARGAVSVLHHLRLLEVAVVAEEEDALFAHFSAQVAHVTGMQATHVQDDGGTTDDADTLATLKLISLYGKSRLKAVVFLVSSEEAVSLLQMVSEPPQIPWLVVTPSDISSRLRGNTLTKVLLLSPENSPSPSFEEYFQQLLQEDTIKYHPLLMEYAAAEDKAENNSSDVSSVTRAVWSLSSALSEVQRGGSCRGGECLRRGELGRALQGFDHEGALSSLRYTLKGFTEEGQIKELGFYSDDEGLNVEPGVFQPESPIMDTRWKIFEDTTRHGDAVTQRILSASEDPLEDLQSVSGKESDMRSILLDPLEKEEDLQSVSGKESNMRSISLTSHQETETHEEPVRRTPLSAWLGRPWSLAVLGTSAFVALSTLYVLVFLLVKACEGGSGGCWLPVMQLLALLCLCGGAALHTWKPAPLVCGLRRLVHNTGLSFCYGGLLLKGMSLRSQSSLGLGGSVNRGNQLLTLLFAAGGQGALELQWWILHPAAQGQECAAAPLASHIYAALLLITAAAVALTTRRLPYNQSESRCLIATSFACALIFSCWCVACWLLPSAQVAAPVSLLATAVTVLLGVFLPQLVALHRHGHKPLVPSYADSLSTVFTMFNNNSSTLTSRGRKKTLEDHS